MKSKRTWNILLIVIVSFSIYYVLFRNFKTLKTGLDQVTQQGLTSYILTYFLIGIPIFTGTYFINRKTSVLASLGLSGNILRGICVSFIFTIPMFAGGFIFFRFNQQIDFENLIAGTIVAGFMEELYFRAFLFGQLFRNTTIGFIPSVLLGALIFASGHLHQSRDVSELTGIFLVTFSGAVFFAWLFTEWKYNLWVPVFTHTFMNLSWSLFDIHHTALGGMRANIFRALTILIAIVLTLLIKRRSKEPLAINRQTLILKREDKQDSLG